MRIGYEFSFDPGCSDLETVAHNVGAAAGSTVTEIVLDDGSPAFAFGLLAGDTVFPVVVFANSIAPRDVAARYPFVATLEAELHHDVPELREVARGIARACFASQPLLVTYDVSVLLFAGVGSAQVQFEAVPYVAEGLVTSKAYAIAAARAREAGYAI